MTYLVAVSGATESERQRAAQVLAGIIHSETKTATPCVLLSVGRKVREFLYSVLPLSWNDLTVHSYKKQRCLRDQTVDQVVASLVTHDFYQSCGIANIWMDSITTDILIINREWPNATVIVPVESLYEMVRIKELDGQIINLQEDPLFAHQCHYHLRPVSTLTELTVQLAEVYQALRQQPVEQLFMRGAEEQFFPLIAQYDCKQYLERLAECLI